MLSWRSWVVCPPPASSAGQAPCPMVKPGAGKHGAAKGGQGESGLVGESGGFPISGREAVVAVREVDQDGLAFVELARDQ